MLNLYVIHQLYLNKSRKAKINATWYLAQDPGTQKKKLMEKVGKFGKV